MRLGIAIAVAGCMVQQVSAQTNITEAFGITFGQKLDPAQVLSRHASSKNPGVIYFIQPTRPIKPFSTYFVKVTPKTGIVYHLTASGGIEKQGWESQFESLCVRVRKMYELPEGVRFPQGAIPMDEREYITSYRMKTDDGRLEVTLASFANRTTNPRIVELYFSDRPLQIRADKEQQELNAEKNKKAEPVGGANGALGAPRSSP